jgi:hypothetical protein
MIILIWLLIQSRFHHNLTYICDVSMITHQWFKSLIDWIFKSLMIFDFHLISSYLIDIIWHDMVYLKRCELCQSFNHWMIDHSII